MDFEAKAREVLGELLGPFSEAVDGDNLRVVADALRAAAVDDDARREARAALQALLEEVKARAVNQPHPVTAPPDLGAMADAHGATPVNWEDPPVSTPVADFEAVAEAARAHGATFDGRTHEQALLGAITLFREGDAALGRLLWILGLSQGERRFVTALAEDASDTVTAEVYADWLEENGRTAAGARVRRLVPRDGDVIVVRHPPGSRHEAHCATAKELADALAARGVRVWVVTMSDDMTLETAPSDAMRAAGWVRAEDVAGRLAYLARDLQAHRDGRVDRAIALHFDDLFPPPAPGDAP